MSYPRPATSKSLFGLQLRPRLTQEDLLRLLLIFSSLFVPSLVTTIPFVRSSLQCQVQPGQKSTPTTPPVVTIAKKQGRNEATNLKPCRPKVFFHPFNGFSLLQLIHNSNPQAKIFRTFLANFSRSDHAPPDLPAPSPIPL